MIIFEHSKFLKDIKKNGIAVNDKYARFKMEYLMTDLIANTAYRRNKIIDITKYIAQDYFNGLPDTVIDDELINLYDRIKEKDNSPNEEKTITLYESEMRAIADLKDDKLMRLAFTLLVIHKHQGQYKDGYYKYICLCDADVYRLAKFENVSGTTRKALWRKLYNAGIIKYYLKTNRAWRFNPSWIAQSYFTIPINIDLIENKSSEKVYKRITNYDDVLSYLYYYLGNDDLTECKDCGCPINVGSQLCSNCASKRKKDSDNKRYQNKKIV